MNNKKVLAFLISIFLLTTFNLVCFADSSGSSYSDVKESDWFNKDVETATEKGYVVGMGNGLFKPTEKITKSQFITGLVRIFAGEQSSKDNVWYSGYISKAIELGIIDSNEIISDNQNLLRQDMARYICKSLGIKLIPRVRPGDLIFPATPFTPIFEDTYAVDPNSDEYAYIFTVFKEYLMEGVGWTYEDRYYSKDKIRIYGYNQTVDRAQLATILVRVSAYKTDSTAYKTERISVRNSDEELATKKLNEMEQQRTEKLHEEYGINQLPTGNMFVNKWKTKISKEYSKLLKLPRTSIFDRISGTDKEDYPVIDFSTGNYFLVDEPESDLNWGWLKKPSDAMYERAYAETREILGQKFDSAIIEEAINCIKKYKQNNEKWSDADSNRLPKTETVFKSVNLGLEICVFFNDQSGGFSIAVYRI